MKLPKLVPIKETTSLFAGKYNYKIVLICSAAGWFRHKNYDFTYAKLSEITSADYSNRWLKIKNDQDLKQCFILLDALKSLDIDLYDIRVESPRISLYTNETKYVEKLAALNTANVKFVCIPGKTIQKLDPGKVVVKTLDYNYKVYLGTIRKRNHSTFIEWAEKNSKIRLTKKCKKDLKLDSSWGGSYFYAKDDKTLTMVKMFLGADISRVEQVIKA